MKKNYRITLKPIKFFLLQFILLLICFTTAAHADIAKMSILLRQEPQLDGLDICYGGGCALQAHAVIETEEWERVEDIFNPEPVNAEEERKAVGLAIGIFEEVVGAKTGTSGDKAGTFGNSNYTGQLDCNDEATNTNTYLKLMIQAGLVRFHQLLDIKTRKFFFNGWPHSSAVIEEITSKQKYAVDSWFYDNGLPAEVIPLEKWLDGWKPEKTLAH